MSVVSVELLWEGRKGRDGIDRAMRFVRVYEVLTDDPHDDEDIAAGEEARTLGLPGNGYPLKEGSTAVVTDIEADTDSEMPTRWLVTVTYETQWPRELAAESLTFDPETGDSLPTTTAPNPDGGPPEAQRDQNPVNWPVKYRVTHEVSQEPATHDQDGDPIVNSAGDPFDPPVMVEVSRPVIEFTKYYTLVKIDWLERYHGSVNKFGWHGRGPRKCKLEIEWAADTINNFPVWRVDFRVKIRREQWDGGPFDEGQGWDLRVLDQGYREINVLTGERSKIVPPLDGLGSPVPGPYPLNGAGVPAPVDQALPSYLTYRYYPEEDWSALGI